MVDTQKTRQNKEARDAVRWARVVYGLGMMTEIMEKQNDLKLRCRRFKADSLPRRRRITRSNSRIGRLERRNTYWDNK